VIVENVQFGVFLTMYSTSNGFGLTGAVDYPQCCFSSGFCNCLLGLSCGTETDRVDADSLLSLTEYSERLFRDNTGLYASIGLGAERQGTLPTAGLTHHSVLHSDAESPQICEGEFRAVGRHRRILSDDIRMHPYGRRFSDFAPWPELCHSTAAHDISHILGHIKA